MARLPQPRRRRRGCRGWPWSPDVPGHAFGPAPPPADQHHDGGETRTVNTTHTESAFLRGWKRSPAPQPGERGIGREDVDESFGPASVVLGGYGRRVGAGTWSDLLSGLTPYLGCLETGSSPGSRSFRHL